MKTLVAVALTLLASTALAAEGDLDQMSANEAAPAKAAPTEASTPTSPPPTADAVPAAAETTTAPAQTAPAPPVKKAPVKPKGIYEGMFTFDWKRLSKCQIVGPVTNAMLTDPKNVCKKADKETNGPASCKISEKSEYLIFKTLADCKLEHEEQTKAAP